MHGQRPNRSRKQPPIDQVIGVVPPFNAVVQVHRVACCVYEEGQSQEDVTGERVSVSIANGPYYRQHHDGDRIGGQTPKERLPFKVLQPGERPKDQQGYQRCLDCNVDPEQRRPSPEHSAIRVLSHAASTCLSLVRPGSRAFSLTLYQSDVLTYHRGEFSFEQLFRDGLGKEKAPHRSNGPTRGCL